MAEEQEPYERDATGRLPVWEPLKRHTCPKCGKQVNQHHEPGVSLSCITGPFGPPPRLTSRT